MGLLDIIIVVAYFMLIVATGIWFGRAEKDTRDFFVGNRQIPWLAVLCSIVATEISAATFLAAPGTGFKENLNYLQFGFGSLCARFFIAFMFLTAFYRFDCITVYDFLAKRFGAQTRYSATLFFFITRLLGSGVRLLIAATGLAMVMGWPLHWTIILFALIAIVYTAFGGIKAIVWTDVIQVFVFIGGGLAVFFYIIWQIPGGWQQARQIAGEAGKLEIFRWAPSAGKSWFNDANIFWLAFFNALITTFAALGTDQDMTQRMLTCKDVRSSQRSLILSGFVGIPVSLLFLLIGVGLFVYYQVHPDPNLPLLQGKKVVDSDKIFAYFIGNALPDGLKGFLLIGILAAAMSSLDSALGALSSSAVVDIYRPLLKRDAEERHYLLISRLNVVFFGVILALIAWFLRSNQGFLWLCFKVVSITYGALLGIFLLGVTCKSGNNAVNVVAMFTSAVINTVLLILSEKQVISLAWTWLILIGTLWTYVIGYCGARLWPNPASEETMTL